MARGWWLGNLTGEFISIIKSSLVISYVNTLQSYLLTYSLEGEAQLQVRRCHDNTSSVLPTLINHQVGETSLQSLSPERK